MPAAFLADELDNPRQDTPALRWLLLGLILLAVSAATVWMVLSGALVAASIVLPDWTASAAAAAVQANATFTWTPPLSPTARPSSTHTLQPSPTAKHSVTSTPTPRPLHLLETPFGAERQFLLHRVLEGERLVLLGRVYQTNVEAIRAVNYNLTSVLWINTVLVIPLNQTDVTGVRPMTAYDIRAEGITIKALALEQGVSLDALCALNDLPTSHLFHSGEWVILPHTPPTP